MTAPADATPLERMLDAVAHLTMTAQAVRDGVYDEYSGAPNYLARSAALLVAADACEEARKTAAAGHDSARGSFGAFFDGMRHAAHVVGQTETPPSHPGVALALANFRTVLQRDLEGRAARREVSL